MARLTSLLINSGDSFLLQNNEESYLIDSGHSQIILPTIPKIINIAICTHNDSDHCNGFIGILKSNSHKIEEIWLPGLWQPIIDFIKNKKSFTAPPINIKRKNIKWDELLVETEEDIENFNTSLDELLDNKNCVKSLDDFINTSSISEEIKSKTKKMIEIVALAHKNKVKIKWFFPDNQGGSILKQFKPINCKYLSKTRKMKCLSSDLFTKTVKLTIANEYSLVFEYQINEIPRILFTADSLIVIPNPYKDQIIVTAPHHGSKTNEQVYLTGVRGNDLIWIRSDGYSKHNPCQSFLGLNTKYCLRCTKNQTAGEIVFTFGNGKWTPCKGQKCQC